MQIQGIVCPTVIALISLNLITTIHCSTNLYGITTAKVSVKGGCKENFKTDRKLAVGQSRCYLTEIDSTVISGY